jgi:hypothetical protein
MIPRVGGPPDLNDSPAGIVVQMVEYYIIYLASRRVKSKRGIASGGRLCIREAIRSNILPMDIGALYDVSLPRGNHPI